MLEAHELMDPAAIFQQQAFLGPAPVPPQQTPPRVSRRPAPNRGRGDSSETDGSSHRVAHTLTACCRCRQRKTRCDPSLPRCLPCERSGSICEYYDTTKGKKIGRHYVIKLQDRVRQLEAEMRALTEEEGDFSHNRDELVRRGGLVRLSGGDESLRYLGPSSGIAMSRLLMEEAKVFTDSKHISELIPEVRARREKRKQSVVMTGTGTGTMGAAPRRKSTYPMFSEHAAPNLPSRQVVDRLVEVFCQRGQILWPVLHEKQLAKDLEDVYAGSDDPYKNYVVRMVIAISLHKLEAQYAGLADSYYLAAMQLFEEVIRPRDLKSLQCLILIGQYSLLTPARMAIYFVLGLATRICLATGLCFERTISAAHDQGLESALTLDLRRRLSWIIMSMEFGLSQAMGRPNGFGQTHDEIDVGFFSALPDENITEDGLLPGPESEAKLVAIHHFRMMMIDAEIRRELYEPHGTGPSDDSHPWFAHMEQKIEAWLEGSPQKLDWCKQWFTSRYYQLRIFLFRPSPQVTQPSPSAAEKCYDGAAYIIKVSKQQMEKGAVDVTWIFLLNLYMSLNILLWSVSYPNIREAHQREEVEELVDVTLDMLEQCTDRWPGTEPAANLYSVLSRACLQVYDSPPAARANADLSAFSTPAPFPDPNEPPSSTETTPVAAVASQRGNFSVPPQFGYVFQQQAGAVDPAFSFANTFSQQGPVGPLGPTFRSNSIFFNPPSTDGSGGRRFSHFAPDFAAESTGDDATPPATTTPNATAATPPSVVDVSSMPTPPDSVNLSAVSPAAPPASTPIMSQQQTPSSMNSTPMTLPASPQPMHSSPAFPPSSQPPPQQQQPLPSDWYNPPFTAPFSFPTSNPFFPPTSGAAGTQQVPYASPTPLGGPLVSPFGGGFDGMGMNVDMYARQGSLSQGQQTELMQTLESAGVGEIDALLSLGGQGNVWV
ncbi:related to purine utilization positive regulator [Cephalotrichum gorgonifer]|uniref:Related to purine utilization positive regulator n=1 Tax=Cephalotrichum gorgonifer TaxID=2041049 RepID=A0AAE8N0T0_9PEZI|nr:related to purine utilization positive regulator [Cephalotrichum gorgonifer]